MQESKFAFRDDIRCSKCAQTRCFFFCFHWVQIATFFLYHQDNLADKGNSWIVLKFEYASMKYCYVDERESERIQEKWETIRLAGFKIVFSSVDICKVTLRKAVVDRRFDSIVGLAFSFVLTRKVVK